MSTYIGPVDVFYRFLAGLSVTHQNLMEDLSMWSLVRTQRYQLDRMAAMIEASEATCDFQGATSGNGAP